LCASTIAMEGRINSGQPCALGEEEVAISSGSTNYLVKSLIYIGLVKLKKEVALSQKQSNSQK
jgi:hypothetical protein